MPFAVVNTVVVVVVAAAAAVDLHRHYDCDSCDFGHTRSPDSCGYYDSGCNLAPVPALAPALDDCRLAHS